MLLRHALSAALLLFSLVAAPACGGEQDAVGEPPKGPPQPFVAMTFNVLCSFCGGGEGYDPWDARLVAFQDLFERHDPDLIGLQELAFANEVDQILALRPGFEAVYYQAADSVFSYPDATILYRASRFEVEDAGFYWLSPTPEAPSSTGFAEGQIPRLVAWARLVDLASRRPLFFASTHFDNNPPSQEKSAPLLLARAAPHAPEVPVVVVGDFNAQPEDEAYKILVEGAGEQGFRLVNTQDLAATWNVDHNQAPAPNYDLSARIDHLFVAGDGIAWEVPEWTVDLHVYGTQARYPSDHRAMVARLSAAVAGE